MKNQLVSNEKVQSPLERGYARSGRLPTSNNYEILELSRFYFNFDTMRTVDTSKEFDKILSLFGKELL